MTIKRLNQILLGVGTVMAVYTAIDAQVGLFMQALILIAVVIKGI